ncbi:MAG: hypothetical protein P1P85_03305 [Patescibacteria group bacterium]|nr:hypothetical protein [Patescibacteria group bacterium]
MEDEQIIKKRSKKPKKIVILFLFIISIITIYLLRDEIMSVVNDKIKPKTEITEDENISKDENSKKEEHTEIADFVLGNIVEANDSKRKSNLVDIKLALQLYASDNNGKYPVSIDAIKLNDENSSVVKEFIKYTSIENMKDPKDPDFYYTYKSLDGSGFELSARLENISDKDCEMTDSICIYKVNN